jgi:hypothetical protein
MAKSSSKDPIKGARSLLDAVIQITEGKSSKTKQKSTAMPKPKARKKK